MSALALSGGSFKGPDCRLRDRLATPHIRTEKWTSECKGGCQGRGWVPNVTTDGLLEALSEKGWVIRALERTPLTSVHAGAWYCALDHRHEVHAGVVEDYGPTPHDAMCAAAKQALEAA